MIAEHKYLVDQGAKLVELRVDFIGRAVNLGRLMNDRPSPIVITARRREDGGRWIRSEQERLMLLRSAIVAGAEYVDIEADVASQISRYGNTKRIISYHDFSSTPDDLQELHAAMAEEDADIIKIATMANSFRDNLRMMKMVRNAKVPTIGICMGEIGMVTRILADRVGSPFTYATFSKDKKMAPGQLNWKEMTELYDYENITDKTELFGLAADPVSESYLPLIHNRALKDAGVDARYLPFRVPAEDLSYFMAGCKELGISGVSVGIPHKARAIEFCSQAETSATGIGAVNTMVFQDDDRLGYNTDYRAAMDCIEQVYEVRLDDEWPLRGMTALVMGAGNVSRAIAWGLRQRKADVIITSRTHDRAQMLASELGCSAIEWEDRHNPKIHLLVNGTPVGMHPDVDSCPYNAAKLNQYMVVIDCVYHPENTLLIKHAKHAQCRIITGVDMFARQGAYQFKLFTGKEAPVKLIRSTIKEATNPVRIH